MPLSIIIITALSLTIAAHALPLQNVHHIEQADEITMQVPPWLHAVTFPLLCYDALAMAVLCWLLLSGRLWWLRAQQRDGGQHEGWTRERGERHGDGAVEREMRRMGMI